MRVLTLYKKRQAEVDGYYVTFLSFLSKALGSRAPRTTRLFWWFTLLRPTRATRLPARMLSYGFLKTFLPSKSYLSA